MRLKFEVEVEVDRITGKFVSRDDISQVLIEEMEGAIGNADLTSLGDEGTSEYEVTSHDVNEVVEKPAPRKRTAKMKVESTVMRHGDGGDD